MLRSKVREYRCECGRPILLPVLPEYADPFYVEHVEREHNLFREEFIALRKEV